VAEKARKKDAKRGRELFEQIGCVKCHTTDKHAPPLGPFLGDVGSKFDAKYIVESVMRPSAKIAQGFATERILTKDGSDYTGFVTHETADEVQLRDPSGKVSTVVKAQIKKRMSLPGSMMPEGLSDNLGIDDFGSLLAYLQSLK
jgi:putative heme-binding domain-containing protein